MRTSSPGLCNMKTKTTLFSLAGQHWGKLVVSAVLAVLSAALTLVPFYIIYLIALELLNPPIDQLLVWRLAGYFVAAVIGRFVLLYASSVTSHIAAFNVIYDLRVKLASHIGCLPLGFFSQRTTGGIKKVLSEDVEQIELFIAHHIPDLTAAIVLPLITIAFFFVMDWRLALAALAPMPLALAAQAFMYGGREQRELMRKYHDSLEEINGTIVEYVRGMPVVKVFNQTVHFFTRFKETVYGHRDMIITWTKREAPPWAAFTVIVTSSMFFILPVGLWLYIKESIELPILLLFLILGAGYLAPLTRVVMLGGLITQINEGLNRINEVLLCPPISVPINPRTPESYDIEFQNVGFAYDKTRVLSGVNLKAPKGTVTALVGPSGAGKTTVARLIPRFWDIQEGDILIGGVNVRDMLPETLMDTVAFVFQDVFMFSDTIFENIRTGMEGISKENVIAAARAAHAHEFISALPDGYNTTIGEGGHVHLSGGEKQRISIARAILKDAPIIILDEATAFADPENEAKIQDAFSKLMKDKTVIVIAHRLSSITDADQIVVIDQGRIVEQGKHERLLAQPTLYKKMWEAHTSARNLTL